MPDTILIDYTADPIVQITFKLCEPAKVTAVMLMASIYETERKKLFDKFQIYIGNDPDWQNNTECPGGPFMDYGDGSLSEWGGVWPYGAEVWCNLTGQFVSIVRDYSDLTLG